MRAFLLFRHAAPPPPPPRSSSAPPFSQYRVSALSKVGADQLTFPDQDNGGQDEIVAKYFGQKYFRLRVRNENNKQDENGDMLDFGFVSMPFLLPNTMRYDPCNTLSRTCAYRNDVLVGGFGGWS